MEHRELVTVATAMLEFNPGFQARIPRQATQI